LYAQVRKKPKEWIPDAVWLNIVALSNMDAFRDIPDSVFRNDGLWRQWYDQEAPEMAKVGLHKRLYMPACLPACKKRICD
jgi:dynein heavy chain